MSDDAINDSTSLMPHRRQSAGDFVMERLTDLIANELPPGAQLPSQRELAERLNVSLPSVREPLAALHAIGLIDVRHGRGMFVSERPALGALLRSLTSMLMRDVSFEELFAVRETIEVEATAVAAKSGSEEEKQDLLRRCEALRAAESTAAFTEGDVEFHLAIARMSRNRLWVLILDMVRTMIQSALMTLAEQRELATQQHESIARFIAAGDAERAVQEMRAHLAINYTALDELRGDGLAASVPPLRSGR